MTNRNSILLLATVALLMISVQQYQHVNADGYDCQSIVGCYADGYDEGKDQGAEDWNGGREHDSQCPPNDSLSFCTGYKVGYEVGWGAARTLG